MHPASRILTYLLAALVIPGLPFFMLAIPLLGALPILAAQRRAPTRLLWRTRWLLLVLTLGYAYGLPGQALAPGLGDFSPTREGLLYGGEQALRLVALLLWLDILVLAQPADGLLEGLYRWRFFRQLSAKLMEFLAEGVLFFGEFLCFVGG